MKDYTLKCQLIDIFVKAERLSDQCRGIRHWYTVQVGIAKAKGLVLKESGREYPAPNFLYCTVTWDGKQEPSPTISVPMSEEPDWSSSKGYCFRFNSEIENTFRG